MNISKYVTYIEATKSETAIRKGIENEPNEEQLEAMKYVAENVFDKIREHIGGPLGITSFYRCPELNAAIGGSRTSQHPKGEAIDIDCDRYGVSTNKYVFDYILKNLAFDQLIWEFGTHQNPAWVHVSLKKRLNRGEVLRAYKGPSGNTLYIPFDLY
jgi:hypothetical protein